MGGANYMGGKRNAMKARARDTLGRKQKAFFGHRRLDMLSKGLSGPSERSTTSSTPFGMRLGPETIALAHAREKPIVDTEVTTSYIPTPVRASSSKGDQGKRVRRLNAHTSSSGASRSEVLDNLDLSEPMFFREIVERILATPDLAGLGTRSSESSNTKPESVSSFEMEIKRKGRNSSVEGSYKAQQPENVRRGTAFSFHKQQFQTPHREEKKLTANKFGGCSRVSSPSLSPMEDISEWNSSDKFNEFVHDSGYTEEDGQTDEDSWSAYQTSLPSSGQEAIQSDRQNCSLLGSSAHASPDFGVAVEEKWDGIPSKIGLCARRDGRTVYGRLFDDPDPWQMIGIILGLEGADSTPTENSEDSFDTTGKHASPFWETKAGAQEMDTDEQGQEVTLELDEEDIRDSGSSQGHQNETPYKSEASGSVAGTNKQGTKGNEDNGNYSDRMWAHDDSWPAAAEDATFLEDPKYVDLLTVPDLEEINGRFIAPSITFDGFESED